jgi:hypothetical protein
MLAGSARRGSPMPATGNLLDDASPLPFTAENDGPLVTRPEAAAFLRVSIGTLERWAKLGLGPSPVRLPSGSIRYRRPDLRALAQGKAA